MRVATLVFCFLLSSTWAENEIADLLDTARDRLRCDSDPKCIDKVGVQRLLHVTNLKIAHFKDLSMVLAHHLLHGDSSCTVHLPTLDTVEDEVMRAIGTEDIAGILRIFKRILKDGGKKKCTGIDDILREMILPASSYSTTEWVRSVLSVLMQYIMKGYCLEETAPSGDSLDNLFNHYGDRCSPYLSAKGIEKMMNDLDIATNDHDHQHQHHDHEHHHDDHLHEKHDHDDHGHHNHEHDNHQHGSDNDHDHHNHDQKWDYHKDSMEHDYNHNQSDAHLNMHEKHDHDDHDHHNHEHDNHQHKSDNDHDRHNHNQSDAHPNHFDHSHDNHDHSENDSKRSNYTSKQDYKDHKHFNDNNSHSHQDHGKDDKLIYVHGNHSHNNFSGNHLNKSDNGILTIENETLKVEVKLLHSLPSVENHSETYENVYTSKVNDLWHPTTLSSEESNVISKIISPPTTLSRGIQPKALVISTSFLFCECLSAESLVSKYGSDRVTISKSEFLSLCPVIVNQRVGDACAEPYVAINLPSKLEVYGYGSVAVAVLCLASLSGALLLPLMRQNARHYIIAGFQGLAFSTLASDALLHLLPEILGLHSHDHSHDHAHSHKEGSFPEPYAQLLLGLLATIYVLFMIEAVSCAFSSRSKKSSGHSHGLANPQASQLSPTEPTLISVKSQSTNHFQMSPQSCTSLDTEIIDLDTLKKPPNLMVNEPVFCGLTSVALVITLGDALHNFGDGLAIGAAFSANIRGGLSTSAAGLCHELPHELGDFIVLLSTGLSYSKALVINFLSSLTCFAGLYLGIIVGDNMEARKWVMAATASTFLYVAMAEMIPELREHRHGSPFKMLLAKNIGIILGVSIMCVISVYEHQMS